MPASFIQHQHGNGARRNALADDGEMFVHRFDVDLGHNNRRTSAAFRADRTEQIGGFETTIARRAWARAPLRPDPRQSALLATPRLVAKPDLHRLARRLSWQRCSHESRKCCLKDACAAASLCGCWGRTESRRNDSLCSSLPTVRSCRQTPKVV